MALPTSDRSFAAVLWRPIPPDKPDLKRDFFAQQEEWAEKVMIGTGYLGGAAIAALLILNYFWLMPAEIDWIVRLQLCNLFACFLMVVHRSLPLSKLSVFCLWWGILIGATGWLNVILGNLLGYLIIIFLLNTFLIATWWSALQVRLMLLFSTGMYLLLNQFIAFPPDVATLQPIAVVMVLVSLTVGAVGHAGLLNQRWRAFLAGREIIALNDELKTANQQLTAQNAELDAFARTVAHDLKNPLGAICGYAGLILDEVESGLPPDLKVIHQIERISLSTAHTVDGLLLLARVRREDVLTEPVAMDVVVAGVLERLQLQIDTAEAVLVLPDEWPPAVGYRPWLSEVWANYIGNALKYGGEPPHIELGATVLDDGEISFWVQDNGRGLTPEEQDELFVEFNRLAADAKKEGHGLGLSIVRRILDKLDGRAGVESEPGHGSRFYFTLPAVINKSR